MDRYWIYLEKNYQGPFSPKDLIALPSFSEASLVCLDGEDFWQPARDVPTIRQELGLPVATLPETPVVSPKPVTRVVASGDFLSPDFQFDGKSKNAKHRIHRSPQSIQPIVNFRVAPLPKPGKPPSTGRWIKVILLALAGGVLWGYTSHSTARVKMAARWHQIHAAIFAEEPIAPPPVPIYRAPKPLHRPQSSQPVKAHPKGRHPWLSVSRPQ